MKAVLRTAASSCLRKANPGSIARKARSIPPSPRKKRTRKAPFFAEKQKDFKPERRGSGAGENRRRASSGGSSEAILLTSPEITTVREVISLAMEGAKKRGGFLDIARKIDRPGKIFRWRWRGPPSGEDALLLREVEGAARRGSPWCDTISWFTERRGIIVSHASLGAPESIEGFFPSVPKASSNRTASEDLRLWVFLQSAR